MSHSRRSFVRRAAATAAIPFLGPRALDALERRLEGYSDLGADRAATSEEFWDEIRGAFPRHPYINLENGYSSPQPVPTWEAFQRHEATINGGLSHYMRRRKADDRIPIKKQLADLAGCPANEIVITRNTTESLGTVIHGIDLEPGDEAVMCDQDYGSMLEQFRQQSRRRGLKLVEVKLPLHPASDEEIAVEIARPFAARMAIAAGDYAGLAGREFDLVINATSASLAGAVPDLPAGTFAAGALSYDMMYARELTAFLAWARDRGVARLADGYGMLVEQAAESFALWRGVRPSTREIIAELRAQ